MPGRCYDFLITERKPVSISKTYSITNRGKYRKMKQTWTRQLIRSAPPPNPFNIHAVINQNTTMANKRSHRHCRLREPRTPSRQRSGVGNLESTALHSHSRACCRVSRVACRGVVAGRVPSPPPSAHCRRRRRRPPPKGKLPPRREAGGSRAIHGKHAAQTKVAGLIIAKTLKKYFQTSII